MGSDSIHSDGVVPGREVRIIRKAGRRWGTFGKRPLIHRGTCVPTGPGVGAFGTPFPDQAGDIIDAHR